MKKSNDITSPETPNYQIHFPCTKSVYIKHVKGIINQKRKSENQQYFREMKNNGIG